MTVAFEAPVSEKETAPRHNGPEPENIHCPYCEWSKPIGKYGRVAKGWLSNHVRSKHPDKYQGPEQPPKKAAAKKTAGVKKANHSPRPAGSTGAGSPSPGRRRSIAGGLADVAATLGQVLQVFNPTLGNVVMFEADAAGLAADEAIAGTWIDKKVVQRGSKMGERIRPVISTLGLPGLVLVCQANPELRYPLDRYIRDAVTDVLIYSLPAIKKRREREQKAARAIAELGELDPAFAGEDPVGKIIEMLFAVPEPAQTETVE